MLRLDEVKLNGIWALRLRTSQNEVSRIKERKIIDETKTMQATQSLHTVTPAHSIQIQKFYKKTITREWASSNNKIMNAFSLTDQKNTAGEQKQ